MLLQRCVTRSFHQSVPPSSPEDKAVSGANITRDLLEPTRTVQPRVSFKTIANRIAPHKNAISCDKLAPYPTHRSATHEYYSRQQGPIYKTEATLHQKGKHFCEILTLSQRDLMAASDELPEC
jgi:hypothetical protein